MSEIQYSITVIRHHGDEATELVDAWITADEAINYMGEEATGTPNEKENVPQIITSWSLHVQSWTQTPQKQLLTLRYEDMLDNPTKVFRKLISFLGEKRDPNRLKKAIRFSSFDQLKQQEKRHGFVEKYENANSFFRKGRKNQWSGKLTDKQVRKIIDDHGEQMDRFKYLPSGFS